MTIKQSSLLRKIPQVDVLLHTQKGQELSNQYSQGLVSKALREALGQLRDEILKGRDEMPTEEALMNACQVFLEDLLASQKPVVINATGVLLHTNLGRAPMAKSAAQAAYEAAMHYTTLEYDLFSGFRGDRQQHVETLAANLLGAQSALVVNNNAAAVLLMLSALAKEREVVVSRGELVEIGGSFRVPDVMAQSGCILTEVGTTNKTKASDYVDAINEDTAALLKVHTSNYKVLGFTEAVDISALSAIAQKAGIPLLADLGSGSLLSLTAYGLSEEPGPREALVRGADVVCFSGDKLLGGPQAGILAGNRDMIHKMKRHPLMRALRPDKMTMAALEATLKLYQDNQLAKQQIPLYKMLGTSPEELYSRAEILKKTVEASTLMEVDIVKSQAQLGGGSAPGEILPSVALALHIDSMTVENLAYRLRMGIPPVIGRIHQNQVLLDMMTVHESQLQEMAKVIVNACGQEDS